MKGAKSEDIVSLKQWSTEKVQEYLKLNLKP